MVVKYITLAVLALVAITFVVVRFAPLDQAALNVDPQIAQAPQTDHALVREDGNLEAPIYEMTAASLVAKLDAIIMATPRTTRLGGDLTTSYASYVTRSALWGFPDVASVKVIDLGEGKSAPVILSRQRYGVKDLGINVARVEGWLEQLAAAEQ